MIKKQPVLGNENYYIMSHAESRVLYNPRTIELKVYTRANVRVHMRLVVGWSG